MIRIDPSQLDQARRQLRASVRPYLFSPDYDITLIDFGFPQRTDPTTRARYWDVEQVALRFHVTKKYSLAELDELKLKRLPRSIGPFQTDVIEAQYGVGLPLILPTGQRVARRDKLCGGLGISIFHDMYGTLGGIVRDAQTAELMILSNWHVLYASRSAPLHRPVYQPVLLANRPQPAVVARATRECLATQAADRLPIDAAVATLVNQNGWENLQLGIGKVTGVAQARLGMEVVKSGLTTGVTRGVVSGIEGFSKTLYEMAWPRLIERVVTISRTPINVGIAPVSEGGDSGAWYLDVETNRAIGVLFAGKRDGTRSQAIDMQHVLEALGVVIATSAG